MANSRLHAKNENVEKNQIYETYLNFVKDLNLLINY